MIQLSSSTRRSRLDPGRAAHFLTVSAPSSGWFGRSRPRDARFIVAKAGRRSDHQPRSDHRPITRNLGNVSPDQCQGARIRGGKWLITGRIASCATLALLLVANASPGSAQGTKMSDVADQLRTALAGESVTVTQQGPVTLTSSADAMFPSGGVGAKPRSPGARQDRSHAFQASTDGDRG